MFARVSLLRGNSAAADSHSLDRAGASGALTGGPSLFPGDRTLLPTPPSGTTDPLAYLVDETLNDLQKSKKYCLSTLPLQRLIFLRRLTSVARAFGVTATVNHLLPTLKQLVNDKEDVIRQSVGIECGNLIYYLSNPSKPQPHSASMRPNEEESPWPDAFNEVGSLTTCPTPVPVYVHPKPSKPTPLDRPTFPAQPAIQPSSPITRTMTLPNSTSSSSPSAASGGTPSTGSSTRSFFAKSKSLLALKTSSSSVDQSAAVPSSALSTPKTPTTPAAETAASSSSLSSCSSTSSSSTSTTSTNATSSTITGEASDSGGSMKSEPSESSTLEQSASSSSNAEPSVTVASLNLASTNSSNISSPLQSPSSSTSNPASPHAKLSTANRAPSSFTDPAHEAGYAEISNTLIPIVQQLLLDSNAEVRTAACDALVIAADVVRESDIGTVVLTCVLNLAHDERDDQRTTAVQLMHELAPKFGYDLCKSFVALELAAFADDAVFKVRKATAQCFGNVCQVVGSSFTVSKLLPCYVRLSKDLIWGVRKGCVDSLVAVAKVVPAEVKRDVFIPIIERFIKDNSRWVRNGAFEMLGPFLHVLGQELITRELLTHYTQIPHMSNAVVDAEVVYHCAFNFPAVLLTLGPQKWDELSPCFSALVKDSKFTVRRTLACSLHQVAHILGPSMTQQHLLPILDAYLKDVDEVKGGIIQSFGSMLRCLPLILREQYVEILWMIQKQKENWRWRYQWAKQLILFSHLFSSDTTAATMIPLTFSLCRDPVYNVRITASRGVGALVKRLYSEDPHSVAPAIHACKAFANGHTYNERQLFVHMCESMIDLVDESLFIEEFLPVICALTADPIKNVRIALATFFNELHRGNHSNYGAGRDDVTAMMNKLRDDVDGDVRAAIARTSDSTVDDALSSSVSEIGLDGSESVADVELLHDSEDGMAASPIDDSDRELDEILGHSLADREEENQQQQHSHSPLSLQPPSAVRARRASAEQQALDLQIALALDAPKEDNLENSILSPEEERQMQRISDAGDEALHEVASKSMMSTNAAISDTSADTADDDDDSEEVKSVPHVSTPRTSVIAMPLSLADTAVPMELDAMDSPINATDTDTDASVYSESVSNGMDNRWINGTKHAESGADNEILTEDTGMASDDSPVSMKNGTNGSDSESGDVDLEAVEESRPIHTSDDNDSESTAAR